MQKALACLFVFFCLGNSWFVPEVKAVSRKHAKTEADSGYQSISETRYRRLFREYLCRLLDKPKSDVLISRFKVIGDRKVPPGEIDFRVFQKRRNNRKGDVALVAIVSVGGVARNEVDLYGWADVFAPVVCVSRNMRRDAIIGKQDVYLARENLSHQPAGVLTDTQDVIGRVLKQSVRADSTLKTWMVEKPATVARGDMVTILAESAEFKISVPGKVLEKGYRGELVRVRNAMSRKTIYARVTNGTTVAVQF